MMPACRMAPPICCLRRHASAMKSRGPARAAPTGAPRPLVKSIHAESKGAAHSWAGTPEATTAFKRRAPSMWVESPRRRATALEVDRMRRLVRQQLLAVAAVHAERDLVTHGARRQEERGLLAEELGDHLLEEIDGRVFELLLVAHFRLAHEAAHVLGGLGDRITGEIDLNSHRGYLL